QSRTSRLRSEVRDCAIKAPQHHTEHREVSMDNTNISLNRIVQRAKDIMTFNTRAYEEIVRDPNATAEAAIVVATIAIASGLGRLFAGPGALIGAVLAMLIGWVVAAAVIYFVGTRITGEATTTSSVERVMRIVGYASAPFVFS